VTVAGQALADMTGTSLIGRLDQHLEAMAEPVAERGGEVLKFLGDGLLAAFPITEERPQKAACAAAVGAAQDALARNEAVNRSVPTKRRSVSTSPFIVATCSTAISGQRAVSISPSSAPR
jgi:class 3 adenylate cyclase